MTKNVSIYLGCHYRRGKNELKTNKQRVNYLKIEIIVWKKLRETTEEQKQKENEKNGPLRPILLPLIPTDGTILRAEAGP